MPEPKKRQRRWSWLDEADGFLTVELMRKAVKQLEAASIKPIEFKPFVAVIGQYADFVGFELMAIDIETGVMGESADPSSL